MTSPYTQFVARGVEVPAIDPRIEAHVDIREVLSTDDGPAALASGSPEAPASETTSGTPSASTSGDGTTSPAN